MKVVRNIANAAILVAVAATLLFAACSNSSDGSNVPVLQQTQASPVTLATPLTLEAAVANATVTFNNKAAGPVTYKVNGGTAQTIASNTTGTISLANSGDKVEFFGDNKAYNTSSYEVDDSKISCSADCYIYGNVMSLVQSSGFAGAKALESDYAFMDLFKDNAHIKNKDGADILLPATTLTNFCYAGMFRGCAGLTAMPDLPATALANSCYASMFRDCSNLKISAFLPAKTLKDACYAYMFCGCSSLVYAKSVEAETTANDSCEYMFQNCVNLKAAPTLYPKSLEDSAYQSMFNGCSSLESVVCLATNIAADLCLENWLNGTAANGTFAKDPNFDSWPEGASGSPSGWTKSDFDPQTVPLTLEALENGCVASFTNKSPILVYYKINGGSEQYVATLETKQIELKRVGDKVIFYSDNKSYGNGGNLDCSADCYIYGNIMSLIQKNDFKNKTSFDEDNAFTNFFRGNSHIKNNDKIALLLPATTLTQSCYSEMFSGCAGLSESPVLPAHDLVSYCYYKMFSGCSRLGKVTCLAEYSNADQATFQWLSEAPASGTFVQSSSVADWPRGENGVPQNWTVQKE